MILKTSKMLLGRKDTVDFPALGLLGIDVKIDTGAYTSSFHCHSIQVKDGMLQCQFLDPKHPLFHDKIFNFKDFKEVSVKSSNGISESRYAIRTTILIFGKTFPISLSLTERGSMKYPVLIGRKFLNKKFIIDTTKKNLSFKQSKV